MLSKSVFRKLCCLFYIIFAHCTAHTTHSAPLQTISSINGVTQKWNIPSFSIAAPFFTQLGWGTATLWHNGQHIVYPQPHSNRADCFVFPAGTQAWNWNDYGVRHHPGVTIKTIDKLRALGCTRLIITQGIDGILEVPQETRDYLERLKSQGLIKDFFIARTEQAVDIYNSLVMQGVQSVGGAFHFTC